MVKTALKKKVHGTGAAKRDERGRKEESRRFTDTRELKSCREHIKLLKKAPSHYCRDRSKSQYLEDGIKSHAHLYRLYRDLCLENNRQAARSDKYREIFQHEFNLSFFRPKKDQCDKCVAMENASPQMKEQLTIQHSEHIRNTEESRKSMAEEQERGKMDPERIIIACFDLQKVL